MTLTTDDTRKLAHLLRRAGFGARPSEWATYASLGVAGTTDRLLHPELIPDHLDSVLQDIGGDYVDFDKLYSLQRWWLFRMTHTQRPLEEKMTLFWHNHFATANYKVDHPRWMWQQNQTLRAHALGNFRTLLGAVSRDPAMLVWLDGTENHKDHPNENYGRELMELFTLGVHGGYTEQDVKEGARAFTGWRFDRETGAFFFKPSEHDDGVKTYLGQTGNFNGDDILDILARHPSTANFLCAKLFKFFVHDDPTPADLAPLTRTYFGSGYDIRAVVGEIFHSPVFYSPSAMYAKIKSPTEFAVTALRTLDAPAVAVTDGLPGAIRGMGQDLFNPPNVKGWPEGKTWMNTMTLLSRVNFVNDLIEQMTRRNCLSDNLHGSMQALGQGGAGMLATPEQIVDAVWGTLLPGHTPRPATRAALVAYVQDGTPPGQAHFEAKAPGLTSLILSAPEYQMA